MVCSDQKENDFLQNANEIGTKEIIIPLNLKQLPPDMIRAELGQTDKKGSKVI